MINYFKSIIETDRAAVVICNVEHIIIYMNPAAIKMYHKDLTGTNLMDCHNERSCKIIQDVVSWFKSDINNNMIYTVYNEKRNMDEYMVALRDDDKNLIGYYEKHEYRTRESAPSYDFTKSLI